MLVLRIQDCARLYTSEYRVHKIITHDDVLRFKGSLWAQQFDITLPLTARQIAIPFDATLKAYIDFRDFSESDVRLSADGKVAIVLPDPCVELTASRIAHGEIQRHVSLLRHSFTDAEMAGYEQSARLALLDDIPTMGLLAMARDNAAHTLLPLLRQMGFDESSVSIAFRKEYTARDVPHLLDDNTFYYDGKEQ